MLAAGGVAAILELHANERRRPRPIVRFDPADRRVQRMRRLHPRQVNHKVRSRGTLIGDNHQTLSRPDRPRPQHHRPRSKGPAVGIGGESKRMSESFSGLKYTFLLALLLTYMIMAAQFESLIQPLIIMATVPLSVIGVVVTLFVSNTPLSSVAVLGVVILAGIVVNNGIVMIDHINALANAGHSLRHSIIEGCVTRLRPIVMTCLVTILGVLPLTLGVGKGDELAQPLAVVTFGGLFISTLLTLFIIPSLYFQVGKRMAARARPTAPGAAGHAGAKA